MATLPPARVESSSGSSLNSYSPIETLERQFAPPLGQRLVIGVQANAACCLEGGVESILRLKGNTDTLSSEAVPTQTNLEESADDDFDAFAFLHDDDKNSGNGAQGGGNEAGNKGIGGFFRKVAKSTTATLERQMQGLAVRIDQGRNPDLLRVAMYDPHTQELLGATDAVALPQERADLRFEVPLVIPGNRRQQQIQLKIWIQSGAALLQSTKAAKNYLLGSATMDCMKMTPGAITIASLSSNLVVGGQLQLCVTADPKFAQVLTRGWSLTDPDMSGYSSNLHYLPLDQSYIFDGKRPEHWLIATERTTESTIVLPIATAVMDLASKACLKSLHHAQTVAKALRNNRHDFKEDAKATCNLGVSGVASSVVAATSAMISISWRRPDSIFELELAANERVPITTPDIAAASPAMHLKFYPKICTENILPGVLQAYGGKLPASGYLLGGLYFCVTIQSNEQIELWETVVGLESFVGNPNSTVQIPLQKNGEHMGNLLLQVQVTMPTQRVTHKSIPADDGLISLVGLETMADGVNPAMDANENGGQKVDSLRRQQLGTMGYFFTTQYMEQHLTLRQSAMESFQERARAYKQALVQPEKVEPYEVKSPKAFRPSSSRPEVLLSGIPFNVHIASLNVSVLDTLRSSASATEYPGAFFQNITHGAPSDHARGFGNILSGISNLNVSGGLRRLEAKRWECAQVLQQAQSLLIAGVGNYLGAARKTAQVNHIPARHAELQSLRWKVFESVHNLHHITWMCSVRRANVFSQSLGLAISSYLATLSDVNKCNSGWPEMWRRHGFMVCFEGLLSAAGKELGMIEDASVAIAMLRMVRVVIMPDNGVPSGAVYVPSSPYLRWVNLFTSGQGSTRHFLLQIGVEQQFYNDRIPPPLRNGTAVQLYPVLYQVGVDIRQWGAHAGSNLMKQNGKEQGGGIVDDEDDDVGVVDNDVLVALNYEALRKMNAFAHAVTPQEVLLDKVQATMGKVFEPQYGTNPSQDQQLLPVHPSLSLLHSHIISSAGRMNHSILDEAATIAQQLGGGGLVFCKSGKDRTAMHVTYKQAQFAARYRDQQDLTAILRDANLIRTYGTRLPICEKNVGQAKYAFNSLQVKFMPDALKPPMNTLAGFLKGGRIFGEGAIES